MYQIRILKAAKRELSQLDKPVAQRVVKRITWLVENIAYVTPIPLSGNLADFYKLRVGSYRVIYEILHNEKTVVIHQIGHRREIYRK